ncbi:MAG: hypothetical protein KTR30_00190 [Saprospiraceae bacterium]|nr:hypothetical protein [Saprospiraceae bacterium]
MDHNQDKEKWIDEKLNSLKGIRSAEAPEHLFAKIEQQAFQTEAKVVSFSQWRAAAAVSLLFLAFNFWAIGQQLQTQETTAEQPTYSSESTPTLVSDFKLYDL